MVARAAYLEERILAQSRGTLDKSLVDNERLEWLMETWAGRVRGKNSDLGERLTRLGITVEQSRELVGRETNLTSHMPLPRWADVLRLALAEPGRIGLAPPNEPFAEALERFASYAISAVVRGSPSRRALAADLARPLLGRLAQISSRVFALEMRRRAPEGADYSQTESEERATAFQARIGSAEGLWEVLTRYPVLARVLGEVTSQWVDASNEILDRLAMDHSWLCEQLQCDLGPVVRLEGDRSDPHRGGRGVVFIYFEGGETLVYKPRSQSIDKAFSTFLAWLAGKIGESFVVPTILDRGTYGYATFIPPRECQDEAAVRRFYRRIGALLGATFVLHGTDMHGDNVIAHGEHPVLVDLEAMPHGTLRPATMGPLSADEVASRLLRSSVLQVGLLPSWRHGERGRPALDLSGVGRRGGDEIPREVLAWTGVGRDDMRLVRVAAKTAPSDNSPKLRGAAVRLEGFEDAVVEGFELSYRALLAQSAFLLQDPSSPINAFAQGPSRLLLRRTESYYDLLVESFEPWVLQSGVHRSIMIDAICRAVRSGRDWPLAEAEIADVLRCNVPLFEVCPRETYIRDSTGKIHYDMLASAPFDEVVARLRDLSPDDLRAQVASIRAALYSRTHVGHGREAAATGGYARSKGPPAKPIDHAVATGEFLLREAVRGQDNTLTWLAWEYLPDYRQLEVNPLGASLYSGRVGVALLFARLARSTGEPRWREAAQDSLATTLRALDERGARDLVEAVEIGGLSGAASLVYGLTSIAEALDDDRYLAAALQLAPKLPKVGEGDKIHDVVSGLAGAILALLRLHRSASDGRALDAATRCGELLYEKTGGLTRFTEDAVRRPGFAHGTLGIAAAIGNLGRVTKTASWAERGTALVRAEVKVREDDRMSDEGASSWCSGLPGVLTAWRLVGGPEEGEREIARAMTDRLAKGPQLELDDLCCGNAGVADILLTLERDGIAAPGSAGKRMARILATGPDEWRLSTSALLTPIAPGMFKGLAGIGYVALRAAHHGVPSVLAFE